MLRSTRVCMIEHDVVVYVDVFHLDSLMKHELKLLS